MAPRARGTSEKPRPRAASKPGQVARRQRPPLAVMPWLSDREERVEETSRRVKRASSCCRARKVVRLQRIAHDVVQLLALVAIQDVVPPVFHHGPHVPLRHGVRDGGARIAAELGEYRISNRTVRNAKGGPVARQRSPGKPNYRAETQEIDHRRREVSQADRLGDSPFRHVWRKDDQQGDSQERPIHVVTVAEQTVLPKLLTVI